MIDSLREASSLSSILQHSRFDDDPEAVNKPGVTKCGHQGCKSCGEVLEVDELYFRNSDITFKIKTHMD